MTPSDDSPRAVVVLVVGSHHLPLAVVERGNRCDLALVDEILRLQLTASRHGWSIELAEVDDDLRALVEFIGVSERLGL
jgi:hypothetical protein